MTLRILIADDHEVVRRGVKALVESRPGWEVVDEVADGCDAIDKVGELHPDLIILDISLPRMDGLEAGCQIRHKHPDTEVLILSYHDSPLMVRKALGCGVRGYVLKSDAARDLLKGVEAVCEHRTFLSSKLSNGHHS